MELLLTTHVAATWLMTGLIWFVQVVHYPLMGRVGAAGFSEYERAHTRRTSWVVGPPMLVEAGTALLLLDRGTPAIVGLALLGGIWLSTAALQVPMHRRLADGFDAAAHRRLVATNWLRTIGWSLRSILVASWL